MDSDERGAGPSAALLLIIGEPFSEDHKTQILAQITKGFRCWDREETGIDINEELAAIANRASLGEEGINGERTIQHVSDSLSLEILINPLTQSVKNSVKKLLVSPCPAKYIVHAGHVFQDTGAWVLQDDSFEFKHLAQVFKNVEVENVLKQNLEASLTIHTGAENHWGKGISKADVTNIVRIQLNPAEKLDDMHGILQFTAYVGSFVKVVPLASLLRASEQFGNISFTRPTLYIFPGCQGDSALFGVNGFNLLVNGGYNRRACFWDFARHLDRVDAMLLTHLGADNIFSVNTVLQRKILDNIHPQIGYLYFNVPEKLLQPFVSNGSDGEPEKDPNLLINLATEGTKLATMAKELGIAPHPCTRDEKAKTSEPINLYHKLGHGSLDMYSLNPVGDSKELKDFYAQWTKQASSLGTSGPFPSQNAMSVCTLIVWKPYNLNEKIVRILFPGNVPQHKIAEGLEKMKTFDFLKHASCTGKDLLKPVAVKKARPGTGTTSRATSSRTDRSAPSRTEARKPEARGLRTSTVTSPTKSSRASKEREEVTRAAPSRTKDVKEARPRPGSAASSRSSVERKATSPRKSLSPSKSPSPPKTSPSKTAPTKASPSKSAPSPKSPTKPSSPQKQTEKPPVPTKQEVPETVKTSNGLNDVIEEIPAAVPEPVLQPVDHEGLKLESDQMPADQGETSTMPSVGNGVVGPPKEVWGVDSIPSDVNPKAGLFTGSSNGFDNEEEEIKPQALPDPPIGGQRREEIFDSQLHEGDREEISNGKSDASKFVTAENENQGSGLGLDSSPAFVFSNDEPESDSSHKSREQNIQYGISNGNGRAMGALQEVDEEDQEEEETGTPNVYGEDQGTAFERNYSRDEEIDTYQTIKDNKPHTSMDQQFETSNGEELQKDETESLEKYSNLSSGQDDGVVSPFDPVAEWGKPMGLPMPSPLDPKKRAASPQKSRMDSRTSRTSTTSTSSRSGPTSTRTGSTRPASGASSRKPASSRSSPPAAKIPPMPPLTAFYVDLTYIPNHGDGLYCDVEFFKRVRARYYVLSSLSPNPAVLDSLLEAKQTWEQSDLEVTIIPTYDNETLRHWVGLKKEKLQECHIDVTPAVSRCTIQLQDLETSLPAYRLEV